MKLGLLCSMYDEIDTVSQTLLRTEKEWHYIHICQSGTLGTKQLLSQFHPRPGRIYSTFPNLADEYSQWELPAQALCRNYSHLFRSTQGLELDYVIAITGDTMLLYMHGIYDIIEKMKEKNLGLGVSKAIGADFHSKDLTLEDLEQGKGGGRKQEYVPDHQPQFYVVNHGLVREEGMYCDINVINRWTSEEDLGYESVKIWGVDKWARHQYIYSDTAEGFQDGLVFHAK